MNRLADSPNSCTKVLAHSPPNTSLCPHAPWRKSPPSPKPTSTIAAHFGVRGGVLRTIGNGNNSPGEPTVFHAPCQPRPHLLAVAAKRPRDAASSGGRTGRAPSSLVGTNVTVNFTESHHRETCWQSTQYLMLKDLLGHARRYALLHGVEKEKKRSQGSSCARAARPNTIKIMPF